MFPFSRFWPGVTRISSLILHPKRRFPSLTTPPCIVIVIQLRSFKPLHFSLNLLSPIERRGGGKTVRFCTLWKMKMFETRYVCKGHPVRPGGLKSCVTCALQLVERVFEEVGSFHKLRRHGSVRPWRHKQQDTMGNERSPSSVKNGYSSITCFRCNDISMGITKQCHKEIGNPLFVEDTTSKISKRREWQHKATQFPPKYPEEKLIPFLKHQVW